MTKQLALWGPPPSQTRFCYLVSKYDPTDEPPLNALDASHQGRWFPFAAATKWGVREVLRELYGWGYDTVTILVETIDDAL